MPICYTSNFGQRFWDSSKNNVPNFDVQQKRLQADHKKKTINIQFDIHRTLKDYTEGGLRQNT